MGFLDGEGTVKNDRPDDGRTRCSRDIFLKNLVGIRWKSLESLTLVQIVDDLDKSNQSHLKFVKNSLESPLLLSSKHLVSGFGEKEPKRTLKFLLSLRKSLKTPSESFKINERFSSDLRIVSSSLSSDRVLSGFYAKKTGPGTQNDAPVIPTSHWVYSLPSFL
jgi:hypothetical protein